MGYDGAILATTNSGATWRKRSSGSTDDITAVAFTDATHGWAVGSYSTLLATTNGGVTWKTQIPGAAPSTASPSATPHSAGRGGGGMILATSTGGFSSPAAALRVPGFNSPRAQ